MYIYLETVPGVFTVGTYVAANNWVSESDHPTVEEAVERMRFLNGAPEAKPPRPKKAAEAATPPAAPKAK